MDSLSKAFQKRTLDLQVAQSMVLNDIATLEEWKNGFDESVRYTNALNDVLPEGEEKVTIIAGDAVYTGRQGASLREKGKSGVPGADHA